MPIATNAAHAATTATSVPEDHHAEPDRFLRIQEVAAEVGLTTRSIRYYEELGLLKPAARSEGSYRLYDDDDLERLRFIKGLRDDAGFSLAEIGQLLEDEAARDRNRERFRSTTTPPSGARSSRTRSPGSTARSRCSATRSSRLEAMIEADGRAAPISRTTSRSSTAGRRPRRTTHAPRMRGTRRRSRRRPAFRGLRARSATATTGCSSSAR